MTVIKSPPVYDLSKYQIVTDWTKINPKPTLVILRATYGNAYTDPTYIQYRVNAKAAGYPVWAYHYFLYEQDWLSQANAFINVVKTGGTSPDLVPIIDIEGYPSNAGVTQATANGMIENFLTRVEASLGRACYIYSSKNYLSYLYGTTPPAWLSALWRYKWIAGYPSNPDQYTTMPTGYLPTGISMNQVALWQYAQNGVIGGISGNSTDLSMMVDWFLAKWGTTTTPTPLTYEQKVDKLWAAHPELH